MQVAPPPQAPLSAKLPKVTTIALLYTDTGAGEEVKAYYAGDPQWGPVTTEEANAVRELKTMTGSIYDHGGGRYRLWSRTSTNVVLVSLRKYNSECMMRRFVAAQEVTRDPATSPEIWSSATSHFLVSKVGPDTDEVPISCSEFDRLPNDPSITQSPTSPMDLLAP